MKIFYINSVVDYGSTGKIVRDLAEEMKRRGHEVRIAYGRHNAKYGCDTVDISSKTQTLFHLLMTRVFGRHGLHSRKATQNLIYEIENFNPDVIHLHNLHGYYLNYRDLMEYLKGRKSTRIIWTLHDLWPITGSSAYYSFDGCAEWDQGCVICNNTKTYPKSIFLHRQRKNFKDKKKAFLTVDNLTIVTVSNWLKNEIKKSYLSKYPIKVIYNGIDYEDFLVDEYEKIYSDKINLLGVANIWEERKGLNDFLALAKKLDSRYHITLIGLSKKQINALPDNITGLERTSDFKELLQFYSQADLYINLSVEETMGLTTVEALATGTPVVVYDQTAVPEIIDESVGKVSPAGDIDELIKSIEQTLERKIDADICKQFARDNYDKKDMMDKYHALYLKRDDENEHGAKETV